jgi:hypothetical protein
MLRLELDIFTSYKSWVSVGDKLLDGLRCIECNESTNKNNTHVVNNILYIYIHICKRLGWFRIIGLEKIPNQLNLFLKIPTQSNIPTQWRFSRTPINQ